MKELLIAIYTLLMFAILIFIDHFSIKVSGLSCALFLIGSVLNFIVGIIKKN